MYISFIYHVYTMYIPCECHLRAPFSCPRSFGSLRPRLPLALLSFGHGEAAHARLGPSKIPQPGVDLVNNSVE